MIYFIFFFLFFSPFFSTRPDYDPSFYTSGGNSLLGSTCIASEDTINIVFCPDDTWAYGFLLSTYNNYGILNIYLDCRDQTYATSTSQLVKYTNMGTYASYSLINSTSVTCDGNSGKDFIRGFTLRMWCDSSYSKGIVEVSMRCCYANDIRTNIAAIEAIESGASWTSLSSCRSGYVACGYSLFYKPDTSGTNYYYGATNMNFKCCKICEAAKGFFFVSNTKLCDHCDINCLSCWGAPTNCTSCPLGYTLTATNSCTTTLTTNQATLEFVTNWGISGWTYSTPPIPSLTTCSPFTFLGGYNVFKQNSWFCRSLSGLASHNTLRVRMKFYRIGTWNSSLALIYIDSILQVQMGWTETSTPVYYGQDCGGGIILQNIEQIDYYLSHSDSIVSINITSNLAVTTGFWAISHFMVLTYNFACDSNCMTCNGFNATQCTSCSTGFLNTNSYCGSSCNSPYFADSTTKTCVLLCTSLTYGDPTTNVCVDTCPTGAYPTTNPNICNYCDSSCLTCSESGTSGCTSCKDDSWLFLLDPPGPSSCESICRDNYYPDRSTMQCLPCDDSCYTCSTSGSNSCDSCSLFLQDYPPSSCVSICPEGYYGDTNTSPYQCITCDNNCATCSTSGSDFCDSCGSGKYLQNYPGPSSCEITCPTGTYPDSD